MKYVPEILRPLATRLSGAVVTPVRRATLSAGVLVGTVAVGGGPAFALGLFGLNPPERVKGGNAVQTLAETDPAAATYNAALNGWSKWAVVIILALIIMLVAALARKHSDRGHEGKGGMGGILIAVAAVAMVGGLAA